MRGESISSVSVRTFEASGRARARSFRPSDDDGGVPLGRRARFLFGKTSARRVSDNSVRTVRRPAAAYRQCDRLFVCLLLSRAEVIYSGGTTPRVINNNITSPVVGIPFVFRRYYKNIIMSLLLSSSPPPPTRGGDRCPRSSRCR